MLRETGDNQHEYVFAVETTSDEGVKNAQETCYRMGLQCRLHAQNTLTVECSRDHIGDLVVKFMAARHKFMMAPLQSPPIKEDGMCTPCQQALRDHFSRRSHPRWWASADWFEANKSQFKAGEYIVIRDAVVLHRTTNETEHNEWLYQNGDMHTVSHQMVRDGVELIHHL